MGRILVVDDKELMRDSVAAILSRKGHTVITAADGHAALWAALWMSPQRPGCRPSGGRLCGLLPRFVNGLFDAFHGAPRFRKGGA